MYTIIRARTTLTLRIWWQLPFDWLSPCVSKQTPSTAENVSVIPVSTVVQSYNQRRCRTPWTPWQWYCCAMLVHLFYVYLLFVLTSWKLARIRYFAPPPEITQPWQNWIGFIFMYRKAALKILSKSVENGRAVVVTSWKLSEIHCLNP